MAELNFKVTEERMRGLKIGVLRKIEDSVNAQFAFVARFMVNGDEKYLSEEEAYEILDDYTLGDVDEIAEALKEQLDSVVPKK